MKVTTTATHLTLEIPYAELELRNSKDQKTGAIIPGKYYLTRKLFTQNQEVMIPVTKPQNGNAVAAAGDLELAESSRFEVTILARNCVTPELASTRKANSATKRQNTIVGKMNAADLKAAMTPEQLKALREEMALEYLAENEAKPE